MSSDRSGGSVHRFGLDGIRGMAVALVVAVHWGFLDAGWIGVQVFFVLSGFLITSILLREREMPLGAYLRRFYWRRTLRIFPLYYAFLLVLLVADLVMPTRLFEPERQVFGKYVISLFLYIYNMRAVSVDYEHSFFFTHFWSLAVEEQFYLLWPFVVHRLAPARFRRLLWALILVVPLLRLMARFLVLSATGQGDLAEMATFWLTPCQLDSFATGALLAVLEREGAPISRRLCACGLGVFAATVFIYGAVLRSAGLGATTSFGFPSHMPWHGQYAWGYTVLNIASGSLIGLALTAPRAGAFVDRWGLGYLGRRSYALYVIHWPLVNLWGRFVARRLGLSVVASFALYLPLLLACAELSWRLLESPILRLKDRRPRRPKRAAAATEPVRDAR